jgi:hypothetical protein
VVRFALVIRRRNSTLCWAAEELRIYTPFPQDLMEDCMRFQTIIVAFCLLAAQACYSDTPYWVETENEPFLNDRAGFVSFTLSYYAVEVRFQEEEQHLLAQKRYSINAFGNVGELIETYSDGSNSMDTIFLYDEKNRLIEEQLLVPNGVNFTLESYQYAENSRIKRSYSTDGLYSQEKIVYDKLGRIIESTDFDNDGKVTNSFHYNYGDNTQTTDWYGSDGKLASRSITYLSSGNPLKREDYHNGKLDMTILYQYSKSGLLAADIGLDQSGKSKFRDDYMYVDGKLSQEKKLLSRNQEIRISYEYDSKGRLMRVVHSNKVNKFGKEYYEKEYIIERTVEADN